MVDLKKRDGLKKAVAGAVGLVFGASFLQNALGRIILKDKASGSEHSFGDNVEIDGRLKASGFDSIGTSTIQLGSNLTLQCTGGCSCISTSSNCLIINPSGCLCLCQGGSSKMCINSSCVHFCCTITASCCSTFCGCAVFNCCNCFCGCTCVCQNYLNVGSCANLCACGATGLNGNFNTSDVCKVVTVTKGIITCIT